VTAPSGQPDPVTSIDWVHRADALQAPWGMFVDGEQRPAISGSVRAVLSPRDGTTVVELGWADEKDVDVAVAAARRAFDEGPWPRLPAREHGVKLSGSGRDKSRHAMDEYTDLKTTWINYG
jgi:gamma-glutamyl-gamma-aminobutyraldehyde dehydrogenase